jgi:hypothetical protein
MRCLLLFSLIAISAVAETRFVRTVTWQWAGDYIDQDIYVTGKVVAGYEIGDRCFLRFDKENGHSFVVIISGEQLKQQPFATPVHAMYVDQPVRVRGVIRQNKFRGRAEMHVQDLSKIEYGDDVLAQPLPLPDEIPDPEEPEEVEVEVPVEIPDEPTPEPEPPVAVPPEPEPEMKAPLVPALDPGPALLPPADLAAPIEPTPEPIPEPTPEPPEAQPLEAAVPAPIPEPMPEVEAEVAVEVQVAVPVEVEPTPPALVPVPEIDDSVAAITLDDAVLDLAPPKPKKPKYRKLDLDEMGVQVIASSTSKAFPGEEEAAIIVDGKSKGSFWSSESSDAQEITVDLKAQFLLRSVALFWESPAAKYHVRTSQDGVIWTTASEEEGLVKGPRADRIKLGGITARFVRIQMLERVVATRGYSLFEFELIGSPTP